MGGGGLCCRIEFLVLVRGQGGILLCDECHDRQRVGGDPKDRNDEVQLRLRKRTERQVRKGSEWAEKMRKGRKRGGSE